MPEKVVKVVSLQSEEDLHSEELPIVEARCVDSPASAQTSAPRRLQQIISGECLVLHPCSSVVLPSADSTDLDGALATGALGAGGANSVGQSARGHYPVDPPCHVTPTCHATPPLGPKSPPLGPCHAPPERTLSSLATMDSPGEGSPPRDPGVSRDPTGVSSGVSRGSSGAQGGAHGIAHTGANGGPPRRRRGSDPFARLSDFRSGRWSAATTL